MIYVLKKVKQKGRNETWKKFLLLFEEEIGSASKVTKEQFQTNARYGDFYGFLMSVGFTTETLE